ECARHNRRRLTDFDMNHVSIWRLRINHFLRFACEFRSARANFKAQAGLSPLKEIRCFKQKGKNFPHFAQTAASKQADEVRLALSIDPLGLQSFDHGMTDKYRAQPRFIVEFGLKRKDTEHQIEKARHLFDAAAVPGPYLRADVVNYLSLR